MRGHEPFSLSWHNVSLTLNGGSILRNATGKVESGKVSSIISSDQEGTLALMETLSDRGYASRYKHLYKLEVRVNGRLVDTHQFSYRKRITFLPTGDAILPSKSTVWEALYFHARMSGMSDKASRKIVKKIVGNLKLERQEDKMISDLTLSEKARARVAIALVSRPAALLLDSPLLALDVYEAFQTMAVLKQVAQDLNIAVLISVDQPSSEVLFAMDEVMFISKGSVIFSGQPDGIVPYFHQLGYACPPSYSPSDFLLFLFEVVTDEEHDRLSSSWLWHVGNDMADSQLLQGARLPSVEEEGGYFFESSVARSRPLPDRKMSDIISVEHLSVSSSSEYGLAIDEEPPHQDPSLKGGFFGSSKSRYRRTGFWLQLRLLYKREILFLIRSWDAVLTRFILLLVLCVMVALMMYRIGANGQEVLNGPSRETTTSDDMTNYYGAISVMVLLAIFGQVEGVSVTIPSVRLLFMAEHSFADFYGSLVFFISQLLVELPLTFLSATIQVCAAYWIVGFTGNIAKWIGVVFCSALATSSIGWLISSITASPLTALRLIPIVLLPQLLFSGLLTDVELIPSWLNWMEYLCYLKYCINLAFLIELQIDPVPDSIQAIADQNSINPEQTGLYISIVAVIILGCRILAAIALYRYRTTQYLKL